MLVQILLLRSTLLVECWSLPLGSGFMLARGIIFSLISLFYIGRVDSPLFASGVGQIGNIGKMIKV